MKPNYIKQILMSEIKSVSDRSDEFCVDPKKHFVRKRKLSFETMLKSIIGMESKNLTNELIDIFKTVPELPSASAFIQQRSKIKPEAFKAIFDGFTSKIIKKHQGELRILAVDGSDVHIATNPKDPDTYFPGSNGQQHYNLLHLNALYDLSYHIYTDVVVQGRNSWNERTALYDMIDRSSIKKALIIADRGYESYNTLAHIQEKGWFFLIRIKDGNAGIKQGLNLPDSDEFDEEISLNLTRNQSKEVMELLKDKNHYRYIVSKSIFDYLPAKAGKKRTTIFYNLRFRIVRFKVTDNLYETVITNLSKNKYPPEKLKELYASRWGIETSFRDLKYTVGMRNFHSKKVMCIHQEIYAHLIMYNFTEIITSHVIIKNKQRKYIYKANFAIATHMCRLLYRGKTTSPNLETIISQNTIPIRNGRQRVRLPDKKKIFHGFLYRVA